MLQAVAGWKVAGVIRLVVNLQLKYVIKYVRNLHESLFVSFLMYGSETVG